MTPPDVERIPVLILEDRDQSGVASQPAGRLGDERRPAVEFRAALGVVVGEDRHIDVHHHLRYLPHEPLGHSGGRRRLRQGDQGVGTPRLRSLLE